MIVALFTIHTPMNTMPYMQPKDYQAILAMI